MIEVLIALVIIGLLITVAFPTYQGSLRKSRRTEGVTALNNVLQAQERWRSNRATYAESLTNGPADTPPGLGMPTVRTEKGYYDLGLTIVNANTTFVVAATGVAGTSQANDGACRVLAVRMAGGTVRYGAAATLAGINWAAADVDPKRCWAR